MKKTRTLRLAKRLAILFMLICGLIAVHARARTIGMTPCSECTSGHERCIADVGGAFFSCSASESASTVACYFFTQSFFNQCIQGCSIFTDPGQNGTCTANCFDTRSENLANCADTQDETIEACNDYREFTTGWCDIKKIECQLAFCYIPDDDGNVDF
jgi:hypothetical protein